MKIKTKLTLNIVLMIVVVGAVVMTSIFGMTFIKGKLSYLTQKSTPYQMRTVEFQRELQSATTDLVKVTVARDLNEYQAFRAEAEKTLAGVKSAQQALEEMSNSKLETADELSRMATELFEASAAKLKTERAAADASKKVSDRLKDATLRLKDLDKRIRNLQNSRSTMFASAMNDTSHFASRARSVEELRNLIKDLQLIFKDIQNAQKSTTVLISKGKLNAVGGKITRNEYQQGSKQMAVDCKAIMEKIDDFAKLQSNALTQKTDDLKEQAATTGKDVAEKLNALYLALDQEATLANEKFSIESNKQGSIYAQSNSANTILINTAELTSLGMSLEGLSTKLFLLESPAEIDHLTPQINAVFGRIAELGGTLEKTLSKLGVKEEMKNLKGVQVSLAGIRNELFAKDGIVATLKSHLAASEQAVKTGDKLRQIVVKQAEKGNQTVVTAKGEQEKAIASVNKMVAMSITLLVAIGLAAVVVGIAFGIWVFRSVSRPLNHLIGVADSVAGGNLHVADIRHTNDEFGQVQTSVEKMVHNLRDMVGRITDSTSTVASSSQELSATAGELERSSITQTNGIEQTATAMTEMVQTIEDVSRNANRTSDSAGRMKQIALEGKKILDDTSRELLLFAEIVRLSAEKTEALGNRSQAINEIVEMIKDIADQTNLLALNASIEAARAGDMGRGFAVVADSVRQLAHRTIESSDEIGRTVGDMRSEVESSVAVMKKEREAIEAIINHVDASLKSMGEIVACVEEVFGMVQAIATATDEQSATAESVNSAMIDIDDVTRRLAVSVTQIKGTSQGFARMAGDLQQMVGWFRL